MSDDVRTGIAEALADSGGLDKALGSEGTATEPAATEAPAPTAATGEVDSRNTGEPAAPKDPAEPTAADVPPTEYWGTSLDGIPDEKRAEIIAHFEQQDSVIHKLQERLATPEPTEPTPPAPNADDEVTDNDILAFLGYNPDNEWEINQDSVKREVTLARGMMALEQEVEQLKQERDVSATQNHWETQLDQLEGTYGKLPGTREGVLKYAVDNQLASPAEVYFSLAAPVKKEVERVVADARRDALKREQAGSPRPRSADAGAPPVTADMSLRDAVKAAAEGAAKEHKVSWREAMKAKFSD